MTDIVERLRRTKLWQYDEGSGDSWQSDLGTEAAAEIARLRALLLRHQVAAWCEDDSDLAVETRAALEPKP